MVRGGSRSFLVVLGGSLRFLVVPHGFFLCFLVVFGSLWLLAILGSSWSFLVFFWFSIVLCGTW